MQNEENIVTLNVGTNHADWLINSTLNKNAPALSHQSLITPRAYYRSKILTTEAGVNPLTTAASTLLTIATQLREPIAHANARELFQELNHEIKAFETRAQNAGYRSEIILVARYVLCGLLDEIILQTSWGKEGQWQRHKLLTTFHGEDWGGERFFTILERLSADPALHIDTLELMYLCLSLGFTGKYHNVLNSKELLDEVTDKLYQCIRWQRGDIKKELAIYTETSTSVDTSTAAAITTTKTSLLLWLIGILSSSVMTSFYLIFDLLLRSNLTPITQQLLLILKTYG